MLEKVSVGHRSGVSPVLAGVRSQNQRNVRAWTVSKNGSFAVGRGAVMPAGVPLQAATANVAAMTPATAATGNRGVAAMTVAASVARCISGCCRHLRARLIRAQRTGRIEPGRSPRGYAARDE